MKQKITTPTKYIQDHQLANRENILYLNALRKVAKLKDKITMYRNMLYTTEPFYKENGLPLNEYEMDYLIQLLSEVEENE